MYANCNLQDGSCGCWRWLCPVPQVRNTKTDGSISQKRENKLKARGSGFVYRCTGANIYYH